jgi:cobalt-zinc-cadmium efflux system membrane fusion protein
MASNAGRATTLSIITLAATAGVALLFLHGTPSSEGSGAATIPVQAGADDLEALSERSEAMSVDGRKPVIVTKGKVESIGLKTIPARRGNWPERLRATGRLELDERRVAHVSSLVEGVIREVPVALGQTVKRGEVLAYIDSREVGEAKLKLVKDQLQLTSAKRASEWYGTIHENTVALLDVLREGQTLEQIETAFRNRPVGAYREQLVSALARLERAKADFERIRELGANSVIPEKEVIRARAEHEAAGATYRALKEQIRFDAEQQALDSQQELQAAEAAVAISRSHLLILGYSGEDIDSMDPIAEAERVAYYPVRSPIAGTVIAKNTPLSQHVDDETELIEIADLSTVWLRADVFEKDLGATRGLQGKSVTFEVSSYPGQQFTAEIFSLGDLVDDETRAARLLAIADNSERLLKPGMFVEIELTPRNDRDVLQLPAAAIQRHAGATFVFVSDGADRFQRRDVTLGRSTSELVEVCEGLVDGESVVVHGGFALKSEMLSELMVEE